MISWIVLSLSLIAAQPAPPAATTRAQPTPAAATRRPLPPRAATPPAQPAPHKATPPTSPDKPDRLPSGTEAPPAPAKPEAAPAPIITLYTMGRGDLMVEKFGHAALCVKYRAGINELDRMCPYPDKLPPAGVRDAIRQLWIRLENWKEFEARIRAVDPKWVPAAFCVWRHRVASRQRGQSVCYNYGTTDFSDPIGLGWGFLRGRSKFWVDPQFFSTMYRIYSQKDRSLYQQVLPLAPEKAWAAARKLEHDVLEENKYYNYHHFYDNCTTRVRDIINDAVDGKLKVDTDQKMALSFRGYGARGFAESTWMLAISDFIFGRGGDVKPTLWQAMFLPRIMRDEVTKRLGVEPVQIYKRKGSTFSDDPGMMGRLWTLLVIVLISGPLVASAVWGRFPRASLWTATVALTLVSIVVWVLAAVSTLYELRVNEACLLFWPSDAALPYLSQQRRLEYARIRVAGLVLVSLLAAVGLFQQPLWMPILFAFVPLFTIGRAWELLPQLAARKNEAEKSETTAKHANGTAKPKVDVAGDEADGDAKSAPNMAAMQKAKKRGNKRKRARR